MTNLKTDAIMVTVIITDKRKEDKMRQTKQKSAILNFLRSKRHHYSATQIYDAIRKEIPNISLGTVYRNLASLIESGEIISVETSDKCVFYDGFISDHAHFVCKSCREIYDFDMPKNMAGALTGDGFLVDTERFVCYGVCKNCSKK